MQELGLGVVPGERSLLTDGMNNSRNVGNDRSFMGTRTNVKKIGTLPALLRASIKLKIEILRLFNNNSSY